MQYHAKLQYPGVSVPTPNDRHVGTVSRASSTSLRPRTQSFNRAGNKRRERPTLPAAAHRAAVLVHVLCVFSVPPQRDSWHRWQLAVDQYKIHISDIVVSWRRNQGSCLAWQHARTVPVPDESNCTGGKYHTTKFCVCGSVASDMCVHTFEANRRWGLSSSTDGIWNSEAQYKVSEQRSPKFALAF